MVDELIMLCERNLPGWIPALYWPTKSLPARAVLVSPNYKIQIGRDAKSITEALASAYRAALAGETK